MRIFKIWHVVPTSFGNKLLYFREHGSGKEKGNVAVDENYRKDVGDEVYVSPVYFGSALVYRLIKEEEIMFEKSKKEAVILANILFENPNQKDAKRLLEIYNNCTPEEQKELNALGIHPAVAPRLKELLRIKRQ